MSKKDEILEELDGILGQVIHYLGGIQQDIKRGDYTPEQAYVDIDFFDSADTDYYSRIAELAGLRAGQDLPDNVISLLGKKSLIPNPN